MTEKQITKYLTSEKTQELRNFYHLPDLDGEDDVNAYLAQTQLLEFLIIQRTLILEDKLEKALPIFKDEPELIHWCFFGIKLLRDKNRFLKYREIDLDRVVEDLLIFVAREYYRPPTGKFNFLSNYALLSPTE